MHAHTSTSMCLIKHVCIYSCDICLCICKYVNVFVSLIESYNFQLCATNNVQRGSIYKCFT